MLGRSVDERVGSALAEGETAWTHIDPIAALGLVGATERAVDAIYRFRQGLDSHAHGDALKAVLNISRGLDRRYNWRYKDHEALAARVLEWWVVPVCFQCTGRAKSVIADTPMLGEACPVCNGSGQRPYPWARSGREGRYHSEVLWALQSAERRIRGKLLSRLAHQIRDAQ